MQTKRHEGIFRLENFESRILLSADAIGSVIHESQPADSSDVFQTFEVADSIDNTFLDADQGDEVGAFPSGILEFAEDLDSLEEIDGSLQRNGIGLHSTQPPASTLKSFEYQPDSGKSLDATLKVEGVDLVLMDNRTQTVLKRQELNETSSILISGSPLDDVLIVSKLDSKGWQSNVTFNAGQQPVGGQDKLKVLGHSTVDTDYLPSKSSGSGKLSLLHITSPTPDEIHFSGVEDLTLEESRSLQVKTPASADRIEITNPSNQTSQIFGTSDGKKVVPITFSKVENLVLDTGINDKDASSLLGAINTIPGVSYIPGASNPSPNDQISITGSINGAMTAQGLKNVSFLTGKGKDSLFIKGNNYSLPVSGGVLGFNGGEGEDTVFAVNAQTEGTIDSGGNGRFGTGTTFISLTGVEILRDTPTRPVIVVPDYWGSFAGESHVGEWFTSVGLHPDHLEIQPINGDYRDIISTLENNGYRIGSSLFIATWDWRLPLAPVDGGMDGVINGITGVSISDEKFEYGVDYLGYALKQAINGWATVSDGIRPTSVDTIAFGVGGLLVRAYLQSNAYHAAASGGGLLPQINNFATVGTPNRGYIEPWSLLQDDWSANLDVRFQAMYVNMSYERLLANGSISTPGGSIALIDITHDGTRLGTPSPTKFIARLFPSLRDILPTFAFIDDGTGTLKSISNDPLLRNNFLLDLNDGLDVLYGTDQVLLNRNPNRFVEKVQGKITVLYSETTATAITSTLNLGGSGTLATFTQIEGRSPGAEEVWYESNSQDAVGDRVVLTTSAIGQFNLHSQFGTKILPKKITDFSSGRGAFHNQLFNNEFVLQELLKGIGRSYLNSDIAHQGTTSFIKKVFRILKTGVHALIQETDTGQETFGGTAAISIFQSTLGRLGLFLANYLDTTPNPDGEPTENIINMGTQSIGLVPIPLKSLARIDGTTLEFQDFTYNKTSKKFSGKVGLGADVMVLFPKSTTFRVTGSFVTGLLEFKDGEFQSFELTIGELRAQFKDLLSVGGRTITISPFEEIIFSAGELFGGIPRFTLEGRVLGLQITRSGEFFVSGFEVASTKGIFHSLNLGKFLPLDLTGVKVKFLGDANNNGFIDPGEKFELTAFDLTVTGRMSPEFWSSFPFTPVVQVGVQNASVPGDELTFTITIDNGTIAPKDIGPVTLGFKDLKIGQVTLASTVTLGGYQNGVFIPDFAGFLKIESGLQSLTGAAQVDITGDFSPDLGRLGISGKLGVGFSLKNGLIKVDNALLDFGMVIQKVDLPGGGIAFQVSPPSGQNTFLNKLQVGLLQVKLGNFLTFQSRNTTLDFNATGTNPMVQFGGTAQTQNPETVFDPNAVPNGSLGAVFGTSAGPIQGWGGAVGNFAIGADLSFQLLQGFFVQIKVGPNAKFGMPSFIPVELRAVTLQFNPDAIVAGELVDPTKFSLIFSGGVKETSSWPLFGQFSGLRVNVQKLVEGDLFGAIENLNGFSIGIKNVKLGPVQLNGALALGLVKVNVTDDQGQMVERSAFYARLSGGFKYSGIGGGVDIVFSEYGPLLSTLTLSGLVIPKIGFVFGFRDAGFVFGGDPLPSVNNPKELLTNPVFHSPTTITLAEIEKRVQNSIIKAQPTWNSAFTLTATGTVTNIYVQGMITGEVTVAANIGLQGPHAGLKILVSGQINVIGLEMGAGAMLIDLSNPLRPQFDMAFALPSPGNPIGFLFPAQATLVASLDTKGLIEMPIVGMGVFFKKLAENTLAVGQQVVEDVIQGIADDLEEDHDLPLSVLLLDFNHDGVVSDLENNRVITTDLIIDRIIGNTTNQTPGILLTSFDALLALTPEALAERLLIGENLLQELVPALLFKFRDVSATAVIDVLSNISPVIQEAAIAGLAAGWKSFDPTFSLTGLIQPVLFGIPLGAPVAEATIIINSNYSGGQRTEQVPSGILGQRGQLKIPIENGNSVRCDWNTQVNG